MSAILIETLIQAPIGVVFDLSRSIELHEFSTRHTKEKAIAGVTTGLIGLSETVTWQARHLFRTRTFRSSIEALERPAYFRDEMLEGDFKKFVHEHFFEKNEIGTLMKDKLLLEAPYGIAGKLAMAVFLKRYISRLVIHRNEVIKSVAESGAWKKILNQHE